MFIIKWSVLLVLIVAGLYLNVKEEGAEMVQQKEQNAWKEVAQAKSEGDLVKADILLKNIELEFEADLKIAAKASFLRGRLAEIDIYYKNAFERYNRAVQLQPKNVKYLKTARDFAVKIGLEEEAAEYNKLLESL